MPGEQVHRTERSQSTEHVEERHPKKEVGESALAGAAVAVEEADQAINDIDKVLDELDEGGLDKDSLDKLFADIDEILEPNAEEFVRSYRQRGGE